MSTKRRAEIVDSELPNRLLDEAKQHPEFWHQLSIIKLTSRLLQAMEAQGVSRAELARRAQLKPSYISRILNNPENITMRTAFRLCNALDLELEFDIRPKTEAARSSKDPLPGRKRTSMRTPAVKQPATI
jgi:ribosome-binding protein aMBF1 (putative translation factor)